MKIISLCLPPSLFCCSADLPAVVCATSCLWPFALWPFNLLSVLENTHTHTTTTTSSDALKLERDVSMKHNVSTWTQTSAHDSSSIFQNHILGLEHLESSSEKSLQYKTSAKKINIILIIPNMIIFFINVIVNYCPHVFYIWNKSQNSLSSHWSVNNSSQ